MFRNLHIPKEKKTSLEVILTDILIDLMRYSNMMRITHKLNLLNVYAIDENKNCDVFQSVAHVFVLQAQAQAHTCKTNWND